MDFKNTFLKTFVAIFFAIAAISTGAYALHNDPEYLGSRPIPDIPKIHEEKHAPGYPPSIGGSHLYEYISNFTISNHTQGYIHIAVDVYLANPTGCTTGSPCPEYDDSPQYVNVWIDWDGNKSWDANEYVMAEAGTGYQSIGYSGHMYFERVVAIPPEAVPGLTYARAMLGWGYNPTDPATYSWTWGSVQDIPFVIDGDDVKIEDIIISPENPVTGKDITFEAIINMNPDLYEIINIVWTGEDFNAGIGSPFTVRYPYGKHGLKAVKAELTYRHKESGIVDSVHKYVIFKLFFEKKGDDNNDGIPNWFYYWKRDGAIPQLRYSNVGFTFENVFGVARKYLDGTYKALLGPLAADKFPTTEINEHVFGEAIGIDCAAETVEHELRHIWVWQQWDEGGSWIEKEDSDFGVPTDLYKDWLPDEYELAQECDFDINNVNTFNLPGEYAFYGDNEYYVSLYANGKRGISINDWAYPGSQTSPPLFISDDDLPAYVKGNKNIIQLESGRLYPSYKVDFDNISTSVIPEFGMINDVINDTPILEHGELYSYLQISLSVTVEESLKYQLTGYLKTDNGRPIAWASSTDLLDSGENTVILNFDGEAIYASKEDGPYIFALAEMSLATMRDNFIVDSKKLMYETNTYNYTDFLHGVAYLSGNYSDTADYDKGLDISFDVEINSTGTYELQGFLFDSEGKIFISHTQEKFELSEGIHQLSLLFPAHHIYAGKIDGNYLLKNLTISNDGEVADAAADAYLTTNSYLWKNFGESTISINPDSYGEQTVDVDADGLYEGLLITFTINSNESEAKNITISGHLNAGEGSNSKSISSVNIKRIVNPGETSVSLFFPGADIWLGATDGPYVLSSLTLFSNNDGSILDSHKEAYRTEAYSYLNFASLPFDFLTDVGISDEAIDINNNGVFDILQINIPLSVSGIGEISVRAYLEDSLGNIIAKAEERIFYNEVHEETVVVLSFNSQDILANGVPGPFYLTNLSIRHAGLPNHPINIKNAHTTHAYSLEDFGGGNISLTVNPLNRIVGHDAGSTTFSIETLAEWSAASDQDWVTVVNLSGSGTDILNIDYQNNSGNERTATITVIGEDTYPDTINVTLVQVSAQTGFVVEGQVINSITENPVDGVEVQIAVDTDDKMLHLTTTDNNGYFAFTNLQNTGPYELGFSKLNYRSQELRGIFAGTDPLQIELVPRGVSTPGTPFAISSPMSVYIDWPANPEINIRGYNLYRTLVNEDGYRLGLPEKLNGDPEDIYSDLLTTVEYIDNTAQKGSYYVYQVQAVSGADRPSQLSDPSDVVKGHWLTLFIPDVFYQHDGLYLWEQEDSADDLIRIPIAIDSAYDVSATSMEIRVELPADLLEPEPLVVAPTGLTAGMLYAHNLVKEGSVYILSIAAAGIDERTLYGGGHLFHIYLPPRFVSEPACGQMHLIEDIPELSQAGVLLYNDPFASPLEVELRDGTYCTEGGCLHGDVNLDGKVSIEDALYILDYLTGLAAINQCYPDAWDINLDGRITSADATLILRYIEGLPINPPTVDKSDYLLYESFTAAGSSLNQKSIARPEVWAVLSNTTIDKPINVPVFINNAPQLSGFMLTAAYDATVLDFIDVRLGSSMEKNFYISSENKLYGENKEFGNIVVTVIGTEPVGHVNDSIELVLLDFNCTSETNEPVPVVLTSIEINDIYGHTPRHTDPLAPIIVIKDDVITDILVPVITGMTQEEAISTLNEAGLNLGDVSNTFNDVITEGLVVSQDPVAGVLVVPGSNVSMVISLGPEPVTTVDVPDLVGISHGLAIELIETVGLNIGIVTEVYNENVSEGKIISQNPAAGSSVEIGSSVSIVISLGSEPEITVDVPNLVGMTQVQAEAAIHAIGLSVGTITAEYSETIPMGLVISQFPLPDEMLALDSAVAFVVSLGVAPVVVPELIGLIQADAEASIENAGLVVGDINELHSDTVEMGLVLSQQPDAGTQIEPGSSVSIVISLGPEEITVEVPNVVGLSQSQAEAVIQEAGLNVGIVTEEYNDNVPEGIVITQSPIPLTTVQIDTAVDLIISSGPEVTKQPLPICGGNLETTTRSFGSYTVLLLLAMLLFSFKDNIMRKSI